MTERSRGDLGTGSPGPGETISTVHEPEPDYYRPLLDIPPVARERMHRRLRVLYGEDQAEAWMAELERVLKVYCAHKPQKLIEKEKAFVPEERFTEKDMILITYGDIIRNDHDPPMKTLTRVIEENVVAINTIHVLPFFPYSSDRGFSVIDFETVDPRLGTWEDFENLDNRYQPMFDGVFNHASSKSRWFQEFLDGNPLFQDVFISYRAKDELTPEQRSLITRPRHRAFHPNGPQEVLSLDSRVFAVLRRSPEGDEEILALVNVTADAFRLTVSAAVTGRLEAEWVDIVTERAWTVEDRVLALDLRPYDVLWLKPVTRKESAPLP